MLARAYALLQAQQPAAALEQFAQVLRLQPDSLEALAGRVHALYALGREAEAQRASGQAAEVALEQGRSLHARAQHAQALRAFEAATLLKPDDARAHYGLGTVLLGLGRPAEALAALERAVALAPRLAGAWNSRCAALQALERPADALASVERALELEPRMAAALVNRGNLLLLDGRADEALGSYSRALEHAPETLGALTGAAQALAFQGAHADADDLMQRAEALGPREPHVALARGKVLALAGRHAEAAQCFEPLLELPPYGDEALVPFVNARLHCCDWRGLEGRVQQVVDACHRGDPCGGDVLAITDDPIAQLHCAASQVGARSGALAAPAVHAAPGARRIRLAYVSGDLREHPVSYLMAGVFEQHDRARFEVTAVALADCGTSPFGQRVRAAFDRYLPVGTLGDAEALRTVRELQPDIVIDLQGHTPGARLHWYAQRIAPVQVNYLGYPGTMGSTAWDYLIADPYLVPPRMQPAYAERIAYLPECFQANDARRLRPAAGPGRAAAGLPEGGLVFACFNTSNKINPTMFSLWMRLLAAVPGSVLWLPQGAPPVAGNLRAAAAARGIEPARLVFAPHLPYAAHLERLQLADLWLDTLPFNGGASISDALWMGVPVLTSSGRAFAARMGGSLLRTIGLPELATDSLAAYERCALALAREPGRLAAIRERLGALRASSPLFDTPRFCRHLEAAYLAMHARALAYEPPQTFSVGAAG